MKDEQFERTMSETKRKCIANLQISKFRIWLHYWGTDAEAQEYVNKIAFSYIAPGSFASEIETPVRNWGNGLPRYLRQISLIC